MQQQLPPKSNLIRQTESAKKKARRKLIGSIFLLFVALVILLNVTARIKPIPVNPETIEIKNTASGVMSTNASQPIIAPIAPPTQKEVSSGALKEQVIPPPIKATSSATTQAMVVSKENSSESAIESKTSINLTNLRPMIINDSIKHRPTPDEILNGKSEEAIKPIYFIQLISLSDKKLISEVRQQLIENGISSTLQAGTLNKKPIYRLRIGPFLNKDVANKRLIEIKNKLGSDN